MTSLALNVLGGLAIFIFGMKMMSDGLHCVAGEKMRAVLRLFSANRFVAILSGTAVTAVIQSSSASTVMVIGFVNAGLLNLVQAIGIIFGANIGTTVTAQLVSFDIGWIVMPAIIMGLLIGFLPRPVFAGWGGACMGLGFLFLGMNLMSEELKQLSTHPMFVNAFRFFNCAPVDGAIPVGALFGAIGVGLAATLLIQSSSACSGIVIALGASGVVNLYTAVALILGSNIGTTVTAFLASIPANRVAKQAALAHTLFNVVGVLLIVSTFWITPGESETPVFFRLVNFFSGAGDLPRKIANAHTIFNVCTTLILVPFIPLLAKFCEWILPVAAGRVRFQRLEPHLLETPEIALAQTVSALRHMLKKAWEMIDCALNIYQRNDEKNQFRVTRLEEKEKRIDRSQREITEYLSLLMRRPLTPRQADRIPRILHCTNDAERIGDHTAILRGLIENFLTGKGELSDAAAKEFELLHSLLGLQAEAALTRLRNPIEVRSSGESDSLSPRIRMLCDAYEKNHMKRLSEGLCGSETGVFYIELLSEIRKVSRHFTNILERAGECRGETAMAKGTSIS